MHAATVFFSLAISRLFIFLLLSTFFLFIHNINFFSFCLELAAITTFFFRLILLRSSLSFVCVFVWTFFSLSFLVILFFFAGLFFFYQYLTPLLFGGAFVVAPENANQQSARNGLQTRRTAGRKREFLKRRNFMRINKHILPGMKKRATLLPEKYFQNQWPSARSVLPQIGIRIYIYVLLPLERKQ